MRPLFIIPLFDMSEARKKSNSAAKEQDPFAIVPPLSEIYLPPGVEAAAQSKYTFKRNVGAGTIAVTYLYELDTSSANKIPSDLPKQTVVKVRYKDTYEDEIVTREVDFHKALGNTAFTIDFKDRKAIAIDFFKGCLLTQLTLNSASQFLQFAVAFIDVIKKLEQANIVYLDMHRNNIICDVDIKNSRYTICFFDFGYSYNVKDSISINLIGCGNDNGEKGGKLATYLHIPPEIRTLLPSQQKRRAAFNQNIYGAGDVLRNSYEATRSKFQFVDLYVRYVCREMKSNNPDDRFTIPNIRDRFLYLAEIENYLNQQDKFDYSSDSLRKSCNQTHAMNLLDMIDSIFPHNRPAFFNYLGPDFCTRVRESMQQCTQKQRVRWMKVIPDNELDNIIDLTNSRFLQEVQQGCYPEKVFLKVLEKTPPANRLVFLKQTNLAYQLKLWRSVTAQAQLRQMLPSTEGRSFFIGLDCTYSRISGRQERNIEWGRFFSTLGTVRLAAGVDLENTVTCSLR